jgi:hypothetical protein
MRIRLQLCLHLLFALFAVFPTSPNSLATPTAALPTKSARLVVFSSVTTTTTEESVLKDGGRTGSSAVCHGQAKAVRAHPTGIPKANYEISAEIGRTLAAMNPAQIMGKGVPDPSGATVRMGRFDPKTGQIGSGNLP